MFYHLRETTFLEALLFSLWVSLSAACFLERRRRHVALHYFSHHCGGCALSGGCRPSQATGKGAACTVNSNKDRQYTTFWRVFLELRGDELQVSIQVGKASPWRQALFPWSCVGMISGFANAS
jgi:hypothetical protein